MMTMLLACVGAGVAIAIPLCVIGHRRRARSEALPELRLERVVSDTRLVRAEGGPSTAPDGNGR
ncbi:MULTISPECIES: hypothetical protein [unclassified Caballeronia]|uniref:hypothetical protein n=1 Tax=unclassified Caballeronia TaxID=2646786 RepID=UPI002866D296|nr:MULTISPECIES: hypothetical protein [unclassified Caballeronia]MDR5740669.1 hypothetical protein [Caballeronia sp. LZ016]MDR5808807.1 hypothetical protein [Caballeronia sp. LZ019]